MEAFNKWLEHTIALAHILLACFNIIYFPSCFFSWIRMETYTYFGRVCCATGYKAITNHRVASESKRSSRIAMARAKQTRHYSELLCNCTDIPAFRVSRDNHVLPSSASKRGSGRE